MGSQGRSITTIKFDLKINYISAFRPKEINLCNLQPNLMN